MKKLAVLLVLLAFAGMSTEAATATATDSYPAIAPVKKLYADNDLRGKEPPPLEVQEWLTGEAPKTKNKVVLIDFWATWCPPCRRLVTELNDYQKQFGKDLVIIGISDEEPTTVKEFMKSHKMKYNVAIDTEKKMKSKVGVKGIPHVLIMSPDNIVRYQGYPESNDNQLTAAVIEQIIKASKTK